MLWQVEQAEFDLSPSHVDQTLMLTARLSYVSPDAAFAAFADLPHLAFLDSAASRDPRSKVSYLCFSPRASLRLGSNPYTSLRDWMAAFPSPERPADWPFDFAGGAVGWIGYDLARESAEVPSRFAPLPGLSTGWFGMYTTLLAFDLDAQQLYYLGSEEELPAVKARLERTALLPPVPQFTWQAEMDRQSYRERLETLREYIAAGDLYQANLTMRFVADRPEGLSLAALYRQLRSLSPAPFGTYLDAGYCGLASASPERFLRLSPSGEVETRPIKGTVARQTTPEADARAAAELRTNPKERAENLMITDLLRNDLSKVCRVGSVEVAELWKLESYAQTHHLVSVITGQLRPEFDAFDLLAATLPGGSITGAPKRRAMQIIDELEFGARGAYCGALAWIGFNGAMDSAILIRTLSATQSHLYAQAGGGITWESNWEAEYEEARIKIAPLLALGQ